MTCTWTVVPSMAAWSLSRRQRSIGTALIVTGVDGRISVSIRMKRTINTINTFVKHVGNENGEIA